MKNLFKNEIALILTFLMIQFIAYGQDIMMANSSSSGVKSFINDHKLKSVDFIYQNSFVTNNNYDETKLISTIKKMFPNPNQSGMAILDWEGIGFNSLIKQTDQGEKYRRQFSKAIIKAKSMRPNIKWSFYALPTREVWSLDEGWRQKNEQLMSLYSNFDFFAPSIYVFYSLKQVNVASHFKYIDANVDLAKKLAKDLNIPVYPVINQRYHPTNKATPNELIPEELFTLYVNRIRKNGVYGIIWWHAEEYNYNISKSNEVFGKDYRNKPKERAHKDMFERYYENIKK